MCPRWFQIISSLQVSESSRQWQEVDVGSIKVEYLRINIEDWNSVQIKMSFPLIFDFIYKAFEESKDFYKSPNRTNPLVDDVF